MVKDKPMPQKGRLLEALLEAGPLHQTLLAAGSPLQQRKNPPPLIPFVGIAERKEIGFAWKFSNQSQVCRPPQNGTNYESCRLMLSNANCISALCLDNMMCRSCDELNRDFHAQSYSHEQD
ncbi:hypothetical protein Ancab_031996 [Ancistrocladus abbreviatus]